MNAADLLNQNIETIREALPAMTSPELARLAEAELSRPRTRKKLLDYIARERARREVPQIRHGTMNCYVCNEPVTVKGSRKGGKPYYNCDNCGVQLFVRNDVAAAAIKNRINKGANHAEEKQQNREKAGEGRKDRAGQDSGRREGSGGTGIGLF